MKSFTNNFLFPSASAGCSRGHALFSLELGREMPALPDTLALPSDSFQGTHALRVVAASGPLPADPHCSDEEKQKHSQLSFPDNFLLSPAPSFLQPWLRRKPIL